MSQVMSLIFALMISGNLFAAECATVTTEGSHLSADLITAEEGAIEESDDLCYPAPARQISLTCHYEAGRYRCLRKVECTYCGVDLRYLERHAE